MLKNSFIGTLLSFSLAATMLWQSGSCHKSNMKGDSDNANQTQASALQQSKTKMIGQWGGQGISMEATDSGATLEFDCASGTITEAVAPDGAGKFSAKGFFVRQHPGPTREGEDTEGHAATYEGVLSGDNLTLTITLIKGKEQVGNFTLKKGQMGRIRRCG